ncbi:MAG: hypothetical protein ACJ76I_09615 [Gaiellaceae bacterium]
MNPSHSRTAGLVIVATVLLAAPLARAGGDFVDLAVGGTRVWFVGEPGVRELDARSGRTIASPHLVGAPYPLSVTLAGGAAWIASVENGYVWGTLSHVDLRTHRVRVLWRKQDTSVQYVAAGAGGVWALIGSATGNTVARFSLTGRLSRVWKIPHAGRMAADASGCWISTDRWLLHIDPAGHVHRVVQAQLGDVATGAGAAWLPQTTTVLRVDEHTGQIRTLHTGRLRLGGFQHDLAAGDGALWALVDAGRSRSILERFDLQSGRPTGSLDVPGIADALIVKPGAIWIAAVIAPPNRPATDYDVIRINPQTLRRTLLVHVL